MADVTAPETPAKESSLRKVVTASMAGTIVEWYEFFLYATARPSCSARSCSRRPTTRTRASSRRS